MGSVALLLGASGSGKGMQAELLAQRLDAIIISTGELLRRHAATFYDIASGDLANSADIKQLLDAALKNVSPNQAIVLDGAARMPQEAEWLNSKLAELGRHMDIVINLNVSEDELIDRLNKRLAVADRPDDYASGIQKRLGWYKSVVSQTLDYWRTQTKVVDVDGSGTPEQVAERIWQVVDAA